jgi:hypothetical protein
MLAVASNFIGQGVLARVSIVNFPGFQIFFPLSVDEVEWQRLLYQLKRLPLSSQFCWACSL